DTWTPALVGVGTVALYVVLAVVPTLFGPPQLWALILANSFKLMAHALLMLYLFSRKVGSLHRYHIKRTTLAALVASVLMIAPVLLTLSALRDVVPLGALGYLIRVLAAGAIGGLTYLVALRFMDVEELTLLRQAFRRPPIVEA
ncbi:MAG: hypothetical protein ACP5J4_04955, partial [Anaerolineae bacterium]